MEWIETTGRSVEEATTRALQSLGVPPEDAEIVVVAPGRRGLLGLGRADARVRARVRPTRPRAKVDNRRRHRARRQRDEQSGDDHVQLPRDQAGDRGGEDLVPVGASVVASSDPSADEEAGVLAREKGEPQGSVAAVEVPTPTGLQAASAMSGDRVAPTPARRRRRRRSRRSKTAKAEAALRRAEGEPVSLGEDTGVEESEEADEMELDVPIEEQVEAARDFVAGVVERMGIQAGVETVVLAEDAAEVRVVGEQLGILVGRGGSTVEALQDLTRTVVQRQTRARHGRLVVDVGDYRRLRREALERFVREVANEVLGTGVPQELDEMPPSDRKVVHDTINLIPGVTTRSVGEEPHRRVVIVRESSESQPAS